MSGERGESMIETVVAGAIVALALSAIIGGVVAAAHRFGPDPLQDALAARVQSEIRIAADALKYQGATIEPNTVATSVPVPGGSPVATHISLAMQTNSDGSIGVTITASADGRTQSASASVAVPKPAPLPSAAVPATSPANAPI